MAAEPYAYVGNNPVNRVDPWGLKGIGPAAVGACATAAAAGTTVLAASGGTTIEVVAPGVTAVCAGAVAVAICDAGGCELVGNALRDLAGAIGSLFSKGISDKSRLGSIESLSIQIHIHACKPVRGARVQGDMREYLQQIRDHLNQLTSAKRQQGVDSFRREVWNKPCSNGLYLAPLILGEKLGGILD